MLLSARMLLRLVSNASRKIIRKRRQRIRKQNESSMLTLLLNCRHARRHQVQRVNRERAEAADACVAQSDDNSKATVVTSRRKDRQNMRDSKRGQANQNRARRMSASAKPFTISRSVSLTCVGSDCKGGKTKAKDERKTVIDRRRIGVEGNGKAVWK